MSLSRRLALTLLVTLTISWPGGKLVVAQAAASSLQLFRVDAGHLTRLDPTTLIAEGGVLPVDITSDSQSNQVAPASLLGATNGGRTLMLAEHVLAISPGRSLVLSQIDATTGKELRRFYSARCFDVSGMSPDGSQVYGWLTSGDANLHQFFVVSGKDGHLLYKVDVRRKGCCFDAIYDPKNARLYILNETQVPVGYDSPRTPVLTAINVVNGRIVARRKFSGLLSGSWRTTKQNRGRDSYALFTPGFALSPQGHELEIVDGANDKVFVVNPRSLAARVVTIKQPLSLFEQAADALGLLPTVADAKQFQGTIINAYYSPDGSTLYLEGMRGVLRGGSWQTLDLGIRAVNPATGEIKGWADRGMRRYWTMFAPDGSGIYTITPSAAQGKWTCPCHLQRLDPSNLNLITELTLNQPIGLVAWARNPG